ncbi:hypothetical protein [Mucilaginibacter xinganensis]|uniref:Helix-turn-helix domain-containing protein n=1 Tax=Mucilaginibacter xinganensis TaxID=1234841 RepID=A0A223NTR0_9SPHI|nr:hypothetical protein [Mucilaginibacter xinganensis]ASU33160.1 hypothetical protein MuYL_1262 [Mucilaginibacter xinganensis]
MNYIAQIKGFWLLHNKHALNSTDTALYFYLLEVCNSTNWINPFKRNNAKVMADLHLSRATFFRSRSKLKKAGILNFRSVNGTPNVTYNLTDLELIYRDRNQPVTGNNSTGCEPGGDPGFVTGNDTLNKNSKPKPKQAVVISCAQAFVFYVETKNNRLLKDRFGLDNNAMRLFFETFYNSKIDLGDLNNKTIEEIARNFYYWLPKHLAAVQKEKSCAKKESYSRPAGVQPLRGVAAALKFANVEMREE